MELNHESIKAMASKEYDYTNPLMKGKYCLLVNNYQYWFQEQADGLWRFCDTEVTTWQEVMDIIHRFAISIGESLTLYEIKTSIHKLEQRRAECR